MPALQRLVRAGQALRRRQFRSDRRAGAGAPGMAGEGAAAQRRRAPSPAPAAGHRERRGDADVVQAAGVVEQAEQERADRLGPALDAALVPAQAGDDAIGGALVLDLQHRPLARLVGARPAAWRSRHRGRRPRTRRSHSAATARSRVAGVRCSGAFAPSSRRLERGPSLGLARRHARPAVRAPAGRRRRTRPASPAPAWRRATPPDAAAAAGRRSRARRRRRRRSRRRRCSPAAAARRGRRAARGSSGRAGAGRGSGSRPRRRAPRNTRARKPSHLGSNRKSPSAGSASATLASIGSIGPRGRAAARGGAIALPGNRRAGAGAWTAQAIAGGVAGLADMAAAQRVENRVGRAGAWSRC